MTDLLDRVPRAYGELIGHALRLIPAGTLDLVRPRFLCGVDPHFVGLHKANCYGYPCATTCHACYEETLVRRPRSDRQPTIVLPYLATPNFVVHEIGHLVDEALRFLAPLPPCTTLYSEVSEAETFAEAFELLFCPPTAEWSEYVAGEWFRPFRAAVVPDDRRPNPLVLSR